MAAEELARTSVFTFGMQKSLSGGPRWLVPVAHKHRIEGRVFRDMNVNGIFDPAEAGLAGVRVQLDSGQTAVTDSSGRYEFKGLDTGHYTLSLPLEQFRRTNAHDHVV